MKILVSILLAGLFLPQLALGAELKTEESVSIQPGVYIQDDLYLGGGNIVVAGNATQDLIAAGGNVLVNGTVGKDALIAGGSLTVLGNIADDLRIAGGNITISSPIGSDLVAAGGQIQILGNGIGGDALVAGGSVRIEAPVRGTLQVRGGSIYINAPITGNVDIKAEKVTLGPSANLLGNLTYSASEKVVMEQGSQVKGKVTYNPYNKPEVNAAAGISALFGLIFLIKFVSILIGAFVVARIFKRYTREVSNTAQYETWSSFGKGIMWAIVLPVAAVGLFITVIGIPFGVLSLVAFIAIMIWASFIAPILLGDLFYRKVLKKTDPEATWDLVLVGVVLFFLFNLIPIVGWIIDCLLILIAIGASSKIKMRMMREWR